MKFMNIVDFYKVDHRRQYPEGTEFVYSNFTPRSSRVAGQKHVVFFGLQYFLSHYLTTVARDTFFYRPKYSVLLEYRKMLDSGLGPNAIDVEHIAALHDYGKVPLRFRALAEGTHVPLRVPMFTVENTHKDFFWMTNYVEDLLSMVWLPCTSATTAHRYRKLLDRYAHLTGGDKNIVPWQGHDFSLRGMASPEAAALSGAAHLLSFTGTDTIPAIDLLSDYYGGQGLIGGSVAATEHSVMCAGGFISECDTFERLLKLYPTGIVSVVSDTWNLWNVLTSILPELRSQIMARNGKLVIRPDSGDPVDILCGTGQGDPNSPQCKGVIELLWDIFGGTVNEKGFKVLDPHIGAIYGDSITEGRALDICQRLEAPGKRFASTNVVLGIGSYTYQYVTRDTYGHAIKATWAQVKGEERFLYKSPITDDGTKTSARGRLAVVSGENGDLVLIDDLTKDGEERIDGNMLEPVWEDGKFLRRWTLAGIRARVMVGH
jgi:nicotinamide phosphoribosyltransferase